MTQRIRESVDIVDLIGSYVTLRRAGANFKGLCPFHEEKTPSFNVHPGKQIFKCFGCGAGGDAFSFIQLREKVDFSQARAILAERAGIAIEEDRGADNQGPGKLEIAKVNRWAAEYFRRLYLSPAGATARAYAEGRGISAEMSQAFAIGFAADSFDAIARAAKAGGITESLLAAAGLIRPGQRGGFYDTFRNRLLFPIVDTTGRVIGFGGRALGDDPAKYLNTPENILFEKGRNVFGLNRAKDAMARTGRGIVVEGYMDCLMAHQHGFDETIATLGTAFTTEQAQLLRRFTDTVILVFDSDEAGAKAADRALSVSLLQNLDVRLARVPTGKDPCDYLLAAGRDAFSELLINAVSAIEFRWRQVVVRCQDDESAPARRRALDEFLEQVAGWVNAGAVDVIQRGLVLNQVAKLLALSPSEVHSRVVALERQARRSPSRDAAPAPQEAVRLAPSTDGVAKAARELIEVLVCEPSLWEQCEPVLAGRSVSDPVLARLVSEVFAWCRAPAGDGGPQVADLIGRLGSPEYGRIITDLQRAGQARGNYAATVQGALFCIEEADRGRQTAEAGRLVRSDQDRESQDRALLALHEAGRARRHFAPLSAKKTGH